MKVSNDKLCNYVRANAIWTPDGWMVQLERCSSIQTGMELIAPCPKYFHATETMNPQIIAKATCEWEGYEYAGPLN